MSAMDLSATFLARSRHYLRTEYPTKLRAAVESLPADALWWRANDQSNSVGNLLMHLAGNIRQWIVSGVGGAPSTRDRAVNSPRETVRRQMYCSPSSIGHSTKWTRCSRGSLNLT